MITVKLFAKYFSDKEPRPRLGGLMMRLLGNAEVPGLAGRAQVARRGPGVA